MLTVAVLLGGPTLAAEPGIYRPTEEFRAPFEVRWSAVSPEASDVVVISDLSTGVAAIRADSGVVVWTRLGLGTVRGVWVRGGDVIVAADRLSAYRIDVGTRVWDTDMECDAHGKRCRARVVHVDTDGVYVASGGQVQNRLMLFDLVTGKRRWRKKAEVQHPRAVVAGNDFVAIQEANPPYAVSFVSKANGKVLGRWVRRVKGIPRPASDLFLDSRGRLVALDLRPEDGSLLELNVVGRSGKALFSGAIPRPQGLTRYPVWATVEINTLLVLVPEPEQERAQLLRYVIAEEVSAPSVVMVGRLARPVRIAGRAWVADDVHDRFDARAISLAPRGSAARSKDFVASLNGLSGTQVSIHKAGRSAAFVLHTEPAAVWSVDTVSGKPEAFGIFDGKGAEVTTVSRAGEALLVGIGPKVVRLEPVSIGRAEAILNRLLDAGEDTRAAAFVERLAPLAKSSATVRRMQSRAAGLVFKQVRSRLLTGTSVADTLAFSARSLGTATVDPVMFVDRLVGFAGVMGDTMLGRRRLGDESRGELLALGRRAESGLAKHAAAFSPGGILADRVGKARDAALVLAFVMLDAGMPDIAADILEPLSDVGVRMQAFAEVYGQAAILALDDLHKTVRPALRGPNANERRAAARAIKLFRHGHAALGDGRFLKVHAEEMLSADAVYALAAARGFDQALTERLAGRVPRTATRFEDRGPCVLTCRALGATCASECRTADSCLLVAQRCMNQCDRNRTPKWAGPAASQCR
ncbi:MAG: hypothetical protein ACI9MR_000130 [Myxococcota bacterium]|jgi:hypothetical protein